MDRRQIDRFFHVLAREFDASGRVILTGAAAGSLWGHLRPSLDIDFAIRLAHHDRTRWARFAAAVDRTTRLTGIHAHYAEDIDRWGPIALLDYRTHTLAYRRFGQLDVRVLDPAYWAIGKLSRYLDPDVQDLVSVLTRRRVAVERLVRILGRALRSSPPSTACFEFRTHVEHFLRTYGRAIWGRRFDPEQPLRRFHREAGISPKGGGEIE